MKRLISAFAAVFVMTLCLTPALGAEPEQHVFDNADIFTDAEEAELEKRIEQFQADVQADAVILTEQDGSVNDPELRAQDFYDANGFGLGSNRSGVILYINMETRDVVACASGETKYVLLNTDLDTVIDAGYDELADGEYADSMHAMLGKATSVIKRHEVSGEYENGQYTGAQHSAGRPAAWRLSHCLSCGGSGCGKRLYHPGLCIRGKAVRHPCPGRGLQRPEQYYRGPECPPGCLCQQKRFGAAYSQKSTQPVVWFLGIQNLLFGTQLQQFQKKVLISCGFNL